MNKNLSETPDRGGAAASNERQSTRPNESGEWIVHVVGPDDVIRQPDELTALRYANALNTHMEKERRRFANDPNYPYCMALVKRPTDEGVFTSADNERKG